MLTLRKLDVIDKAILGTLARNCRITNASLAKALRVSKDTIAYRIARLEQERMLEQYLLFIDARVLGFTRYHLLVRCATSPGNQKSQYSQIGKHPNVMWVNSFVGKFDMQIIIDAESPFELDRVRNEIFSLCTSPVQDYTVLTHLGDLEFTQLLPDTSKLIAIEKPDDGSFSNLLDSARFPVSRHFSLLDVDALDIEILKSLANDCRITISVLERTLGVERATVRRRIIRMIRGKLILSFGAVTSVSLLGYVTYYLLVRHAQNIPEAILRKTFDNLGNVFYAGKMLGNYDMILYLNARSPQELNESIAIFRDCLSKYILTYDLLVQEEIHYWRQFTKGIETRLLERGGNPSSSPTEKRRA